jgi:integrase
MSVYRPKNSPFYQYDFECRGHRFHGSTKCTSRREAEAVKRTEKEKAKRRLAETQTASTSLLLDHVIDRYWVEVGQHHVNADTTWTDLSRLIDYFGKDTLLTEITDDDVARLVAWRRGHRIVRSKKRKPEDCPFIGPATVNRTTTEVLKKLFTCAKTRWGVKLGREPKWRTHMLKEPEERVRELVNDEGERLEAATPKDYLPFFEFVRASGLRQREALLRWTEVNWQARQIAKIGKGGKHVAVPITSTIAAIIEPLQGHHPEFVFTYAAQQTRGNRIRGRRYPLTLSGVRITWRRLREKAGVVGFRFHDFRHDLATKILRDTGNLKLVQKVLNHADLNTTLRYAHVLDDEVAAALERVTKSRKKSRTGNRKTA